MPTKIEWCDETINPVQDVIKGKSGRGYHCTKISPGCDHCYAESINKRFGNGLPFDGRKADFMLVQKELEKPLRWKKPKRIFWQSMGDLFHDDVPFPLVEKIFHDILWELPREHDHIFLTKRPKRMKAFFEWTDHARFCENVWIGVTVCTQDEEWKISKLLQIDAAVRFVSFEPLLGPVEIPDFGIDWVICGGESGPGARPCHPDWVRSLRDQCQASGTPFFFKQWGEWAEFIDNGPLPKNCNYVGIDGSVRIGDPDDIDHDVCMGRVGKKSAGRLLDGREWSEFPR